MYIIESDQFNSQYFNGYKSENIKNIYHFICWKYCIEKNKKIKYGRNIINMQDLFSNENFSNFLTNFQFCVILNYFQL